MQAINIGIPHTRAQSNITTHVKKDDHYPNDVVRERCVCY
jgi:hypothetical protein